MRSPSHPMAVGSLPEESRASSGYGARHVQADLNRVPPHTSDRPEQSQLCRISLRTRTSARIALWFFGFAASAVLLWPPCREYADFERAYPSWMWILDLYRPKSLWYPDWTWIAWKMVGVVLLTAVLVACLRITRGEAQISDAPPPLVRGTTYRSSKCWRVNAHVHSEANWPASKLAPNHG